MVSGVCSRRERLEMTGLLAVRGIRGFFGSVPSDGGGGTDLGIPDTPQVAPDQAGLYQIPVSIKVFT